MCGSTLDRCVRPPPTVEHAALTAMRSPGPCVVIPRRPPRPSHPARSGRAPRFGDGPTNLESDARDACEHVDGDGRRTSRADGGQKGVDLLGVALAAGPQPSLAAPRIQGAVDEVIEDGRGPAGVDLQTLLG